MKMRLDAAPIRFYNSPEFAELQHVLNAYTDFLETARDDLFLQMNLETATWGMRLWEEEYGIQIDDQLSLPQRRLRVKVKMQGTAVTTLDVLKRLATKFTGLPADIEEITSQYVLRMKLQLPTDTVTDIKGLLQSIEELKPAHLAAKYTMQHDTKNASVYIGTKSTTAMYVSIYPQSPALFEAKNKAFLGTGIFYMPITTIFPDMYI